MLQDKISQYHTAATTNTKHIPYQLNQTQFYIKWALKLANHAKLLTIPAKKNKKKIRENFGQI